MVLNIRTIWVNDLVKGVRSNTPKIYAIRKIITGKTRFLCFINFIFFD